jgi:hypothetical protein
MSTDRRRTNISGTYLFPHAVFLNHTPKVFSATATYATAVLVADPFAIAPPPARYRILARIEARQHSPPANTPVSPRPPPLTA